MNRARFTTLSGMILAVAATRLLPHPPNVSPVAAMALFGGAYFEDKRLGFLIPLSAMFLSDLILGFHSTLPFVYGSFALITLMGFSLQKQKSFPRIATGVLLSSILFFVVTNFGVWLMENLYPKNFPGLLACYTAAVPFFRNTLIGDFGYSAVLFGAMELVERTYPNVKAYSRT